MFIPDSDFLCLMSAYVSGVVTCVYTCKFSSLTVRARVGSKFLELTVEELSFWRFISKLFNLKILTNQIQHILLFLY